MSDNKEVKIVKKTAWQIVGRKGIRAIVVGGIAWLVVYAILAASMTRWMPTNLGTIKAVSTNFAGGHAPAGAQVLVDPTRTEPPAFWDNLLMAVTPNSNVMYVRILAGPYGDVDWEKYGIDRDVDVKLATEYLFECLEGCQVGDQMVEFGVMSPSWIIGVPVEKVV